MNFKAIIGHEDPLYTINLDELNNLELWGANVDLKSYDKKWTIQDSIQNMIFHPTNANPCVMMRENLKPNCCEYIAVYLDDLYIASPKPEDIVNTFKIQYKLKINTDYHLGAKYPNDPGGTMICQLKKYIEELHEKFTKLFKDSPSKDLETLLDKKDHSSAYLVIMKILSTRAAQP